MKKFALFTLSAAALFGCQTEIRAPEPDYPVFGPYMTPEGNQVKNPLSWSRCMHDPFVVWDAAHAEYVLTCGTDPRDKWDPACVWVHHHHLLADILQSSSCSKKAYVADGGDGVWGPVREPALVKDADGKWRIYATALAKKDDESTRREVVLESATDRAWSDYRFKGWSESRRVVASKLFGYDCRGLVKPGNGVPSILSATPFKSPDGRETWLAYSTFDPELPEGGRRPIVCVQRLDSGPDGKPLAAPADPFGKWRICPSGEPPVTVTR